MIVMYGAPPPHLLTNLPPQYYVNTNQQPDRPPPYVLWPLVLPQHLLAPTLPPPQLSNPPMPQQVSTLSAANAMCELKSRHLNTTPQSLPPQSATPYDAITIKSNALSPTTHTAHSAQAHTRVLHWRTDSYATSDGDSLSAHDSSRYTSPAVSPSPRTAVVIQSTPYRAEISPFPIQYAASSPASVPSPVGVRRTITRDSADNNALFSFIRHFFATHATSLRDKSTQEVSRALRTEFARAHSAGETAITAIAHPDFSHKLMQRAARSLGYTLTLHRGLVDNRIETSVTEMHDPTNSSSSSSAECSVPIRRALSSQSYAETDDISPSNVRVPLYDTVRRHKISGFACPKRKNLSKYLARHPHCILYNAERDSHLLTEQQQPRSRRRHSMQTPTNMTITAPSTVAVSTSTAEAPTSSTTTSTEL